MCRLANILSSHLHSQITQPLQPHQPSPDNQSLPLPVSHITPYPHRSLSHYLYTSTQLNSTQFILTHPHNTFGHLNTASHIHMPKLEQAPGPSPCHNPPVRILSFHHCFINLSLALSGTTATSINPTESITSLYNCSANRCHHSATILTFIYTHVQTVTQI